MKEELGILTNHMIPAFIGYHTASDGERQRIHYFHVKDWKGRIKSMEAEAVYWESDLANLSVGMEKGIVLRLLNKVRKPYQARRE